MVDNKVLIGVDLYRYLEEIVFDVQQVNKEVAVRFDKSSQKITYIYNTK